MLKETVYYLNISMWHVANAVRLITLGYTQIAIYNAENNSIV